MPFLVEIYRHCDQHPNPDIVRLERISRAKTVEGARKQVYSQYGRVCIAKVQIYQYDRGRRGRRVE